MKLHRVTELPVSSPRRPDLPEALTLAHKCAVLAASGCETASLTAGVDSVADPVDLRVVLDGDVVRVDENALVVLEGTILIDPVGVEEPERWKSLTSLVLSEGLEVELWSELVDVVSAVLTVEAVLGSNPPAATLPDADAVDDIALLGLVAEAAGLVRTGRMGQADKLWELTVFPAAEAEKEAHDIALLLGPEFAEVGVSTH